MSLSGVNPEDACFTTYQELKLGKKFRYILFTINDDLTKITVEKTGRRDKTSTATVQEGFEAFADALPKDACRWAVYDFEIEMETGKRSKLCFISWSPDNAMVKSKMLCASSQEGLRRRLDGTAFEVQATDRSEITYETVLAKAQTFTR